MKGHLLRFFTCLLFFIVAIPAVAASQPMLSITALYKAPTTLAKNSFAAAVYQITNHASVTSFTMQPIQGVTQITTTANACSNPIHLAQGQSCNLNLRLIGSQMPNSIVAGPVICAAGPYGCNQPSQTDSLQVTISAPIIQNNWISVLIDQDGPTGDLATYVNQIITLAPGIEQIHLRVFGNQSTNYALYANLINLLRTAYPQTLSIGFHPDNFGHPDDIASWGCANTPTWQCVLNASIISMNGMNSVADPNHSGQGFNIFSIEESYIEPVGASDLQNIKVCLNQPIANPAAHCPCLNPDDETDPVHCQGNPHVTSAAPAVTFGNVLASYGGSEIYGPYALDFGYPQYYNLGKRLTPNGILIPGSAPLAPYFPTSTTSCVTNPDATDINVVDVSAAYTNPIPCNYPTSDTVYTDPGTAAPTPSIASAYVAYLMTQLPPISNTVDTSGATVYLTFSGEASPTFLGAPGWSLTLINQFHTDLMQNFTLLQQYQTQNPSLTLFPSGGTNPSAIKYAIWSYAAILNNE